MGVAISVSMVLNYAGSRLQKMWFQVTGSDGSAKIMTLVSRCTKTSQEEVRLDFGEVTVVLF